MWKEYNMYMSCINLLLNDDIIISSLANVEKIKKLNWALSINGDDQE